MNDPFDSWFRRFGGTGHNDPFAQLLAEMQQHLRHLDSDSFGPDPDDEPGIRTWSYGYRMTTGPDGERHVETWGDAPDHLMASAPGQIPAVTIADDVGPSNDDELPTPGFDTADHRTPHTTSIVDAENGTVTVTAEMPGIDAKDIQVDVAGDRLHIHAATGARRYSTEVHLDATVEPDALTTSYRHGILEIRAPVKTA